MEQEPGHETRLNSAEFAMLWASYINDSLSIRMFKQFLQHVDDTDTRLLMETALRFSQGHIQTLTQLFTQEQFPIPQGFTDSDVNLNSPRLYSDTFYLFYINGMSVVGMTANSAGLSAVTRLDVRGYYAECFDESKQLYNRSVDLMLQKGIYIRPPFISTPDKVVFVQDESYLTGFFGERRPLNSIEISHLFMNSQKNSLGRALLLGFAQVAQSQKVRQYMERGITIARKHIRVFSDTLVHSNLPAPMTWDSEVSDSTTQTFSDKLMMFHTAALNGVSMGNYGVAMGTSARRDLALMYSRLMAEVGLYAEDGAEMAIENGWMEEPPMANDRKALARSK